MPNAAVVGTQLNAFTIRKYGIYVGGQDVRAYVPIETVRVTEAGPGDVSSASFVIEDTNLEVPIPANGAEVSIWDLILDYPIFAGYLNDYSVTVIGIGRNIVINAFGLEALLDWIQIPLSTVPVMYLTQDINWLANTIAPQAGLIAPDPGNHLSGNPFNGNATWPIGAFLDPPTFSGPRIFSLPTVGPSSLRTGIELLNKWALTLNGTLAYTFPVDLVVTVDFYRRLRVFTRGQHPDDYTDLVVNDATAGPLVAANLNYEVHPGDVVRSVYVTGGNAAGSGWVGDGSGIFGRQANLDEPLSTTADLLASTGAGFLATQRTLVRGSFVLENYVPTVGTIHPGSFVTITDAQVGQAAQVYPIATIDKTFQAATQTWTVHFGGKAPSFITAMRNDYSRSTSWKGTLA